MTRERGAEKREVMVSLNELAFRALTGGSEAADPSASMEGALLYYLSDGQSDRPAWSYPSFLRGSETRGDVELELEVASDLWRRFEQEATRQEVSIEQLAEHAVFYFRAELDAGRVTERILDDLGVDEDDSSG